MHRTRKNQIAAGRLPDERRQPVGIKTRRQQQRRGNGDRPEHDARQRNRDCETGGFAQGFAPSTPTKDGALRIHYDAMRVGCRLMGCIGFLLAMPLTTNEQYRRLTAVAPPQNLYVAQHRDAKRLA